MMINTGVTCNVSECEYNREHDKCGIACIKVACDGIGCGSVETPHFCKTFEKRTANVR